LPELSFWVPGIPQPQGSTKNFKRGAKIITTSDNVKLRPWRNAVSWQAQVAAAGAGLSGLQMALGTFADPVVLYAEFYFPRPKGHFGKRGLLPSAPTHHTVKPDLSKLVRAIEDSLTDAGIWRDDNQVVTIAAAKHYTGNAPGVQISVRPITAPAMAQPAALPEVTHHRKEGQVPTSTAP
jgi:Holliday junction resolvase RusA-like endonuclease